ncbi:MAG: hypothetical protein J6U15_07810, partial [Lachnospiraceae bacterium]|nr:hypothetical protein [Lachnospiraceae bacterium]
MIVRAAFATSDGKYVDRHFGAAERFDIYEINTETDDYERVDVRLVEKACLDHKHHDERMDAVTGTIEDCHAVFAELSGNGARAVLESKNIQPIDIDRPIMAVVENILYGKVKLIDKRYTELPKKRKNT